MKKRALKVSVVNDVDDVEPVHTHIFDHELIVNKATESAAYLIKLTGAVVVSYVILDTARQVIVVKASK